MLATPESLIFDLADSLSLPRPEVWEVTYSSTETLLHELGHWAVTPRWAIDWWKAMKPTHYRKSIAPPIPYLFHPGQVLPDDLSVVAWTAEVQECMGWNLEAVPTILMGDRPAINLPEAGLSGSVANLRRFGINPLAGQFTPVDDGFTLPHPTGTSKTQIVENWQAIAAFYPDRCASDFRVLSPQLDSLLDRQLALAQILQAV
jgi:hypothetical protein